MRTTCSPFKTYGSGKCGAADAGVLRFCVWPEAATFGNQQKQSPMFSKDKNASTEQRITSTTATLISAGTVLQGDLKSENDLRIDGTIQGNVTSKAKIIVGPEGFVEGAIDGAQADVAGKVKGDIVVKELAQLRAKSNVQGNITAQSLQIEAGAAFNGQSIMTATLAAAAPTNVVKMKEEEKFHAKAN